MPDRPDEPQRSADTASPGTSRSAAADRLGDRLERWRCETELAMSGAGVRRRGAVPALLLLACMGAGDAVSPAERAAAQQTDAAHALATWTVLDAAPGYESRVAPELEAALPGWRADRYGNLVRTVGSGTPVRVVACALDRPALAATQITDDGYLRVHRIGRGTRHPLQDQAFMAQQVRVLTREGPVAGVVARANGHFGWQHRGDTAVLGDDDLWVDVGAASAEEARAMGIELLDPIVRHLPPWSFEVTGMAAAAHATASPAGVDAGAVPATAGRGPDAAIAGPAAGRSVGCAAVASVAEQAAAAADAPSGTTRFVLSAQEEFGWVGLSSLVTRLPDEPLAEVVVVAPGAGERTDERRPVARLSTFGDVLAARGLEDVRWLAPAVASRGSHVERVTVAEAEALRAALASALEMDVPAGTPWVAAPAPAELRSGHFAGEHDDLAATLEAFVERHGVSGHEWPVSRLLLASMPSWARERAIVDDIGNVIVEMGPERDTTVFMAHLDEVGYEVRSIAPDGVVTLGRVGGSLNDAWEGQTALLHFDPPDAPSTATGTGDDVDPVWKDRVLGVTAPAPLRGVILTRDDADTRSPGGTLEAWFGRTGAELEAAGVAPGAAVTSHKEGLRLGPHRYVARSLDDRAGTTALLHALRRIDPDRLDAKVIFTWSVHEEGGLVGSEAMARRYAPAARRIYSVDTFVSSDTPLETPHFAYAPLGAGPVLRAIESSGISPDVERDRVRRIAREAGIPLQTGLTQGGTDGTTFTFRGAPNQGLSWPGRYSHSPGEVLDLRDLSRLVDLVVAVASAGG